MIGRSISIISSSPADDQRNVVTWRLYDNASTSCMSPDIGSRSGREAGLSHQLGYIVLQCRLSGSRDNM